MNGCSPNIKTRTSLLFAIKPLFIKFFVHTSSPLMTLPPALQHNCNVLNKRFKCGTDYRHIWRDSVAKSVRGQDVDNDGWEWWVVCGLTIYCLWILWLSSQSLGGSSPCVTPSPHTFYCPTAVSWSLCPALPTMDSHIVRLLVDQLQCRQTRNRNFTCIHFWFSEF